MNLKQVHFRKFFEKTCSILANFSLFLHIFLPYLAAIPAYAEDPTPTPVPTEIIENTSAPEPLVSPEPTPEPLVSPEPTAAAETPFVSPEPTAPAETPFVSPEPTAPAETPLVSPEPTAPAETPFVSPEPTAEPLVSPEPTAAAETPTQPVNIDIGTQAPVVETEVAPTAIPVVEKVCLTGGEIIEDTTSEDWIINDTTGISETKENVKLGLRYVYPQDTKVTIIFKCLPADESLRTPLKIQKIKSSELKLPDELGDIGEYAYDITTGMSDGTFEYDVTLPKPDDSTAEVSYIEKSLDDATKNEIKVEEIKPIEESKTEQSSDTVKAVSIDHFTIFVIVENPNPTWTQTINWQPYTTMEGEIVNDYEDGVFGLNDPSNGGTNVSPKGIDLASGANNSGINPGNEATLEYYYDTNNNSPNCQDDSLYLRMRLAGDPRGGGGIYKRYHWDFLVGDPASQNSSKYVIDIFGGKASNSYIENTADGGTIGVYENDLNSTTYTPNTGIVWSRRADNTQNAYTRLQEITYDNSTKQYWIEGYLPLSTFNSNQKQINFRDYLCQAATSANGFKDRFFASTSASNTDPLQKDWMDATAFFTKFSKNKSVANITNPGAITEINPAKTGDILVYTLTVKNDGSRIIPGFSIEDEIADILEYALIIDGDYDNNGKTGALSNTKIIWPAQNIPIGGSLVEKFSVQIKPTNQWSGTDFVMSNVYGDTTTVDIVKSANLTIVKKVVNDNGGTATIGDFEIKLNSNILSFDSGLVDETTTTYTATPSVSVNTSYLLSENDLPDYTEGNWSCKDVAGAIVSHNPLILLPGQDITCTITNDDRPASIIIEKQTFPDGSSQSFEFNPSWSETNFNLSDGQSNNSGSLVPGTYSVTEITPEGWDLTSAVCSDQSSVDSISLQLGETVTCTFTNTKRGSVSGVKYEDYDGDLNTPGEYGVANWIIELWKDGALKSSTTTSSSPMGFYSFTNLEPGDYIVKEVSKNGWYSLSSESINVTLDAGENDTNNNFYNTQYSTVTVYKEVDTDGDGDIDITNSSDWTWNIGDVHNLQTGTVASSIRAGYHTISENQKNDHHVTSFRCNNGQGDIWPDYGAVESLSVEVVSGQDLECIFTNVRDTGDLVINKVIDEDGDLSTTDDQTSGDGWDFSVTGIDFIDSYNSTTDTTGTTNLSGLKTGEYAIFETVISGYEQIYWSCDRQVVSDPSLLSSLSFRPTQNLLIEQDLTTTCTFYNTPNGSIHGYKWHDLDNSGTLNNEESLLPGWTINLYRSIGDGEYESSPYKSMNTDVGTSHFGWYWFDHLFPGNYQVCEELQIGWSQTYPLNPVCHEISIPDTNPRFMAVSPNAIIEPTPEYNFGNVQLGYVEVTKFEDLDGDGEFDEGEDKLDGWDINLSSKGTKTTGDQQEGQVLFGELLPDTYYLSETMQTGWTQTNTWCEAQPSNEPTSTPTPNPTGEPTSTPTPTEEPTTTPTPTPESGDVLCHQITGNSCMDKMRKSCNPGEGWQEGGCPSTLNRLFSVQPVIAQEAPTGYRIDLKAGQKVDCYIGNQLLNPQLTIAKSNDAEGEDRTPGSSVGFKIIVNVLNNDIDDLIVTDLPSEGFVYRPGSYKVSKKILGGVMTDTEKSIMPNDPTYESPGVWNIGDVKAGDVIELSYLADISSDQQPGLYKDLVYAHGQTTYDDTTIYAEGISSPFVADNFVGTEVNIIKETQNTVSAGVEREVEGQVLGASTELPATGASTIWLIISALMSLIGLAFIKKSAFKFATFLFLTIFSLFFVGGVKAVDVDSLSVRLEQPKSPTNINDLKLTFVALDLDNKAITVKCFKKGPSDSGYSQFGADIPLDAPGDTSQCETNSSILNTEGPYLFYVTANGEESNVVSLDYKTSGPGTPSDYRKEWLNGGCDYKIHFKTADDGGKTVKVELYRADITDFILDSGSRVASINIDSNQESTITNTVPDCSKSYYYVLRAFDDAGNGSGTIGDTVTITKTSTTVDTTTTTSGAIPVTNATISLEEESTLLTGTPAPEDLATDNEEGTVLGTIDSVKSFLQKSWLPLGLGLIGLFAIIRYALRNKKKSYR